MTFFNLYCLLASAVLILVGCVLIAFSVAVLGMLVWASVADIVRGPGAFAESGDEGPERR